MGRVLVTGANGFVGRALVRALLAEPEAVSSLCLLDQHFGNKHFDNKHLHNDKRIEILEGDFFDPQILARALAQPADVVFHLASVPGGAAERDFDLGQRVNLHGSLALFEGLRNQPNAPVLVFASTIAVYGSPLPALVDANTPPNPNISYGTHKLVAELLLQDLSRRGVVDGRVVRLPGIVARPLEGSGGMVSAFMSNVMHHCKLGRAFVSPVSPDATMWWMSLRCCVQNLLHAANLPQERIAQNRVTLLPALYATMGEVVAGLAKVYGADRLDLVRYEAIEAVEAGFGRFPPMDTSVAEALGFRHDGGVNALIQNALIQNVLEDSQTQGGAA